MVLAKCVVNLPQGLHEGIVLTVSGSRFFILGPVNAELHYRHRTHSARKLKRVVDYMDIVSRLTAAQNVCDDERKVLCGHRLLLVAEFDHSGGHEPDLFRSQAESERVKVVDYVGFAAHLAEGIGAFASEAFRKQAVCVQVSFLVSVCMHAAALGKNVFAYHRFVVRNPHARNAFHVLADVIEAALVN